MKIISTKNKTTYEVCNNISKHKHLWGIEALKLVFQTQVTYKINQINIQLQLLKNHAKKNQCN
jgi:hypothetical protein